MSKFRYECSLKTTPKVTGETRTLHIGYSASGTRYAVVSVIWDDAKSKISLEDPTKILLGDELASPIFVSDSDDSDDGDPTPESAAMEKIEALTGEEDTPEVRAFLESCENILEGEQEPAEKQRQILLLLPDTEATKPMREAITAVFAEVYPKD